MKKYKRPSVNIPKELLAALDKRIVEVGYPSHSAYFLGLMLFDLWAGQGHAVAVKMMSLPPKERVAAMEDIGLRPLRRIQRTSEPSQRNAVSDLLEKHANLIERNGFHEMRNKAGSLRLADIFVHAIAAQGDAWKVAAAFNGAH
jgi:hypothetical protein